MRRMTLATFAFIFCLSWAEVKVEKVLETTSIKEYNQWVKKNKARYPELKPYYLKVECIKWGKEWKIFYYNEDGDLAKEELLKAKPGWELYVQGYPYWGKVMLVENDSSLGESSPIIHTIKNEKGETIFSFEWGFDYPTDAGVQTLPGGIGLLRSRPYEEKPLDGYADLFTWDGIKIGKIEHLCAIDIDSKATPDKHFMVLNSQSTGIVVKDGKELWRRPFVVCLSNDGQYFCVGDASKMHTYHVLDSVGNIRSSFSFKPAVRGMIRGAFSPDNKYLGLFAATEVALYDNLTKEFLWKKNLNVNGYYKRRVFVTNQCIILAYLGGIHIYNLNGNLATVIREENSNKWEVQGDLLIIDKGKIDLNKVIYKLEQVGEK